VSILVDESDAKSESSEKKKIDDLTPKSFVFRIFATEVG